MQPFIFYFSVSSQKWSLLCSLLALAIASAKLYFSQRLGGHSDPDPTLKMVGCIMPIILFFLSGLLYSLVFVATYIQGYILLTITSVIGLNGFILFIKYFQKNKREELRRFFYPTDAQQGKKESGFVFFTAVLTSWISSCSVWANTFGQETWFLFLSSSTSIAVYVIHIITIGISEKLGFLIPTENPPITRCFNELQKYNSSKYRLFLNQNNTLLDIFKVCNNYDECQPAIRICSENENTYDVMWNSLIPVGIVLLAITGFAALILQNLGHHYTFLKLLIQSCSVETNNFANAFNVFWKNTHLLDKNIQDELQQQMKNAVVNSEEKKEAVNTIFNIFNEKNISYANEKLLMTNLSLLTSTKIKSSVWNSPIMHKAVENNNYIWFSFLLFLGGECGGINGQKSSSINKLREKTVKKTSLLYNYNFITRWLIKRALKKHQEFALHTAAAKGNHQEIERLIANSYDLDLKDDHNQTPLHIASKYGHFDIAKILVANDADKESKDENDQTPLHLAAKNEHFEIVKYLVENDAVREAKDENDQTPLHIAAENGTFEIVKYLAEKNADKESKDKDNQTPLHLASRIGHFEIAKILVDNLADKESKDTDNQTPLQVAVKCGHLEIVKYLVEIGADKEARDENGLTLLMWASQIGHITIVKILVDNDADKESTDEDDQTPLHLASRYGHFEIVKYLVEMGAGKQATDKHNQTPLHIAAENGHFAIAKILVANDADKESKDENDQTPLHLAAENGHFEIVKYLVENDAEKEAKQENDWTPLHLAAEKGYLEIVKFLFENGAEKEAKTNQGSTSMHLAAQNGHLETVKYLVQNGAEKDAKKKDDWTPLHKSAQNGHLEIVKLLVQNGAETEAKTNQGSTPLHRAAENGHLETVKCLVQNGAEKEAKTNQGSTPLRLAAWNGHLETVKFLVKIGAEIETKEKFFLLIKLNKMF
jgi:ankyrin repeat protein